MSARLQLPTVTLCAATSVNVAATVSALGHCLDQVEFADCILCTDVVEEELPAGIRRVAVPRMHSSEDYSRFMLSGLVDHIRTDHLLVVQWDGYILEPSAWDERFLEFDYIGAPWPQFIDGHDVGNGGFSLRSRRLLEACRLPEFIAHCPEDVAICRTNREWLERHQGIRFADLATAGRFAFERTPPAGPTFGFHGAFNMMPQLGADAFWEMYRLLDHRGSLFTDFGLLFRQLGDHPGRWGARLSLTADRARASLVRARRKTWRVFS